MNPTRRERRLIAGGLLVAVLVLAWVGLVRPVARGFDQRATERRRLIEAGDRQAQAIAALSYWRAQAQFLRRDEDAYALVAVDRAGAVEAATDRVAAQVTASGGAVRSIREQPASPSLIRLHADLSVSLTQLVASLKALEDQRPFVIVEKLSIAADPASGAGRVSPLDAGVDLAVPYVARRG